MKTQKDKFDISVAKYPEYYGLTEYHKKCLPSTNYWRVMNGGTEIPVPALDTNYYKYFDKRCYDLAESIMRNKG